jgi:hypothetical protein
LFDQINILVKILIITVLNFKEINLHTNVLSWADTGFQVRVGALKKIAPSGGRRENVRGITCEKSRFYAKKIIFFPILGGSAQGAPPTPGPAPDYNRADDRTYLYI